MATATVQMQHPYASVFVPLPRGTDLRSDNPHWQAWLDGKLSEASDICWGARVNGIRQRGFWAYCIEPYVVSRKQQAEGDSARCYVVLVSNKHGNTCFLNAEMDGVRSRVDAVRLTKQQVDVLCKLRNLYAKQASTGMRYTPVQLDIVTMARYC